MDRVDQWSICQEEVKAQGKKDEIELALLLLAKYLVSSQVDAIRKAIAGEGRLYLVPPIYLIKNNGKGELVSCEIVKEQDQGGE